MDRKTVQKAAREMAAEIGLINVTKVDLCGRLDIPQGSFEHFTGGLSFGGLIESMQGAGVPPAGEVTRGRVYPGMRKRQILASAVNLACDKGYRNITRSEIAEAANVSPALVTRYFESMDTLRDNIMEAALIKDIPELVAQGLANGDPIALSASPALKQRAADHIAGR